MNYKKAIEEYEYYNNGYNRLSGYYVKAVNVKPSKYKVTADVILSEGESGVKTRYNDCVYTKEILKED